MIHGEGCPFAVLWVTMKIRKGSKGHLQHQRVSRPHTRLMKIHMHFLAPLQSPLLLPGGWVDPSQSIDVIESVARFVKEPDYGQLECFEG